MGVQDQNNTDRLRTVWTPEMDVYFIGLMLEQVSIGNKLDDNLFSKRAWKHMILLFNAEFKFHYEKDVLKNRHKSLRNLYKAIKNLLDQAGFYWDDTRQMVIANNNIWDAYIQAHPDARSYRIKRVPYYKDLCIIYGRSFSEHRDNGTLDLPSPSMDDITDHITVREEAMDDSLQDIMIDDFRISVPEGVDDDSSLSETLPNLVQFSSRGSRTRTYWQPPMDRHFIDLMLDQVQRGNQVDGIFSKQAWFEMVASFNVKFGFNYEADILKNRYKTLRRQYNVIKNLLELDGFTWDDSRQMVIADDHVWQDYIKQNSNVFCLLMFAYVVLKRHTDARQFMTRPVPYYKDLCIICRDPSFDDREFLLSRSIIYEDYEVNHDQRSPKSFESHAPSVSPDEQEALNPKEVAKMVPKRKPEPHQETGPNGKKVCSQPDNTAAPGTISLTFDSCSIEDVVEAVQALPDMDDELILDACDLLDDEKKAKTFMALDVKLRKKWLLRKLRPNVVLL